MVWWDDLWSQRGLRDLDVAYKIVDAWRPEWRIWMDFEGGKGSAMLLDSLQAAHPIRAEIANAEEAGESFDAITYEKGGAVLRMIEGFLGEEKFRDGIRLYMRRHREANATADDLWGALAEASGQPIVALRRTVIRKVGYLVTPLSLDPSGKVSLAQRRFFADPDAREAGEPTTWLVPMVLRFRDTRGTQEQRVLLDAREKTFALEAEGPVSWCLGNAEARGFFRTAYDAPTLAGALPELPALRPAERMTLCLRSVGARARRRRRRRRLPRPAASSGTKRITSCSTISWGGSRRSSTVTSTRPSAGASRHSCASCLGPGPPSSDGQAQEKTTRRACAARRSCGPSCCWRADPAAVAEAVRRLPPRDGGPSVDPNLLDVVVTAAARTADAAAFEELRRRAREEADPAAKRRYLHALARVEDPALATRAVELSLGADVPMQDFTSFLSVLLSNRATREEAWRLVKTRFAEVRAKADSPMLLRRLVEALAALPERRHLEEITAFLEGHPIEGASE